MAKVYLISDLHIGHTDIHNKWRQEFSSQNDHDESMCRAWNSVVRKNDIVKVLGDFIIGIKNLPYIDELNGQIHWILGNHDPKITDIILNKYPKISYVGGLVKYKGVFLSHAPVHQSSMVGRNDVQPFNIHGHSHSGDVQELGEMWYNVNADVMGIYPREFHSIMREAGKE